MRDCIWYLLSYGIPFVAWTIHVLIFLPVDFISKSYKSVLGPGAWNITVAIYVAFTFGLLALAETMRGEATIWDWVVWSMMGLVGLINLLTGISAYFQSDPEPFTGPEWFRTRTLTELEMYLSEMPHVRTSKKVNWKREGF